MLRFYDLVRSQTSYFFESPYIYPKSSNCPKLVAMRDGIAFLGSPSPTFLNDVMLAKMQSFLRIQEGRCEATWKGEFKLA